MKTDFRKIVLRHSEYERGISEENVAAFAVKSHKLMLTLLECFKGNGVIALNPASLIHRHRFPAALCAIFVQQTVLDNFELKLSDSADNLAAVELVCEELCYAFVHELLNTFVELLGFHGVGVLDIHEQFRREARQPFVMKVFALGECVADFECAVIGNAHDVAGECFVDDAFFLSHKRRRSSKAQGLARAHVFVGCVTLKFTGTNFDKRNTAAVIRIHIGVNLEYESGESLFGGFDSTFNSLDRSW